MEGICSFCGTEGPLIKAHVVPASLYRRSAEKSEALIVINSEEPSRHRKSQTGIYDNNLVCRICEDVWDPWDSYAAKMATPIIEKGSLIALRVDDYNFENLKMFFLSVAWRCGASRRKEFSMVKLGPYEKKLKEAIENKEIDHPAGFDISVSRFDDTNTGTVFLNPHCERWDGVNHLRIYMFGYTIIIKMDRRPMPIKFRRFRMEKDQPLYIGIRKFNGSPEHRLILSMLHDETK